MVELQFGVKNFDGCSCQFDFTLLEQVACHFLPYFIIFMSRKSSPLSSCLITAAVNRIKSPSIVSLA